VFGIKFTWETKHETYTPKYEECSFHVHAKKLASEKKLLIMDLGVTVSGATII